MSAKELRIAIGRRNYGYRRVAYGLPVPDVRYVKAVYVPFRYLAPSHEALQNTYFFANWRGCRLAHLWNGVCLNRRPWVTSFECQLPRFGRGLAHPLVRRAFAYLASPWCKRLLALSDAARNFFALWADEMRVPQLARKLIVFRGGVAVDEDRLARHEAYLASRPEHFRVILVGHQFFSKGGVALVRAFERVHAKYPHARLCVVSRLLADAYASRTTEPDRDAIRPKLAHPGIEWHEQLPHDEVLARMAQSHVAALPTLDETLGWSALEAMSAGLPVIGSNIFAMPENVIGGKTGFSIQLPLRENRRWIGIGAPAERFPKLLAEAYDILTDGIERALCALIEDDARLRALSRAAVEQVRAHYDPQTNAKRLKRLYIEALEAAPC